MKSDSFFKAEIYTRGIMYQKNGNVLSVENDGFEYHAVVKGTKKYHVTMKLEGRNIIDATCDCPYAKDGSHCKHEAAVYHQIVNGEKKSSRHFFSAKEDTINLMKIYNGFRRTERTDYRTHKAFKNKLIEILDNINVALDNDGLKNIEHLLSLIQQFTSFAYPYQYQLEIYDLFLEKLKAFVETDIQYGKVILNWLKPKMKNVDYSGFDAFRFQVVYLFEKTVMIDFLIEVLTENKRMNSMIIDQILSVLYVVIGEDIETKKLVVKKLAFLSDENYIRKMDVEVLMSEKKYKVAKARMDEMMKKNSHYVSPEFYEYLLEIAYQLNDIHDYQHWAICILDHNQKKRALELSVRLKNMASKQWDKIKYGYLDAVGEVITEKQFASLLHKMDEWEYVVYFVLNSRYDHLLPLYKDILLKKTPEIYFQLCEQILKDSIDYQYYNNNYTQFDHFIDEMIQDGCSMEGIHTILYQIEEDHQTRPSFLEHLAHYKKKMEVTNHA